MQLLIRGKITICHCILKLIVLFVNLIMEKLCRINHGNALESLQQARRFEMHISLKKISAKWSRGPRRDRTCFISSCKPNRLIIRLQYDQMASGQSSVQTISIPLSHANSVAASCNIQRQLHLIAGTSTMEDPFALNRWQHFLIYRHDRKSYIGGTY